LANQTQKYIYYTLRIATSMCFIGHGAFGIISKPLWCNYFAVFGISHQLAYKLMPILGSFDILIGIFFLIIPLRIIPWWLVIWGVITALLRPLSGEPFPEFIERAGNFGAPLVLLLISGSFNHPLRNLFKKISPDIDLNDIKFTWQLYSLRVIAFLIFIGHGWLNFLEKTGLLQQYARFGIVNTQIFARALGIMEILGAFILLIRPSKSIVFILLLWKMGTELLYPQYELFEWIERGGSYGILLALWFTLCIYQKTTSSKQAFSFYLS
jgi:uncharacterized membrane protein YphA (DoxX/SURF4 family)